MRAVSEWVSAVFAKYPELARLKRDQRIQDSQHQSARVQRVASDQASIESTANKLIAETFQSDLVIPSLFKSDIPVPLATRRATSSAVTEYRDNKSSAIAFDQVTDPKTVSGLAPAMTSLYPVFVPMHRGFSEHSSIGNTRGSLKSTLCKPEQVGKVRSQHKPVQNTFLDRWCQSQPARSTNGSSTQDVESPLDSNGTVSSDPCPPVATDGSDPAPPIASAQTSMKPS